MTRGETRARPRQRSTELATSGARPASTDPLSADGADIAPGSMAYPPCRCLRCRARGEVGQAPLRARASVATERNGAGPGAEAPVRLGPSGPVVPRPGGRCGEEQPSGPGLAERAEALKREIHDHLSRGRSG